MNWNLWDDEEEDIPDSVKKDTHMIFGRDPEGHPIGFTRVGIADDVLDWAGLNGLPYQAREYLNGRMTLQEWADEYFFKYKGYTIPVPFIKPSINKLAQGMAPWPKYAMELWSGKSMFPDVYNPRTIRNRGQYIARELGLLYPYNYVMDIPQPAISWRSALKLVAYTWEPKQTHYNAFRYDKVPMWVAEHSSRGRSLGGFSESAEAEALYLIREAVKYDNRSALLRGIDEYKQAGGTVPNLDKAITRLHPLGALKEAEWKVYRKSLSRKENAQLDQAILFWKINFDNKRSEIKRAARERRLPLTKARK
jgi:hypothetical protein